ncbi:hypothetical protein R3P38DRAFT_2776739 [Favolaschia claudopus]|uniref:Uncharacterized protein n=1 Tax=Favolaschia claudopus TaxID=2862362 RepID=A0AAW0BMS1_9AGAR
MPSSHIEALDHTWVAAGWPTAFQFFNAIDIPIDEDALALHSAYVGRNRSTTDHTRSWYLLYRSPPVYPNSPSSLVCPVGIRVQGFVEYCNLKALGDYPNKRPEATLQHMVLSGGKDHAATFRQYKQGVEGVVDYVYRMLDVDTPPSRTDNDTLFIGRRVFSKVTPGNRRKPSVLEAGDDPRDLCKAIDRDWRVLSKLSVGQLVEDEVDPSVQFRAPCEPRTVTQGDFVDVCIGFDIVEKRGKNRETSVQVHLRMEHVLLLAAAADIVQDAGKEDDDEEDEIIHGPGTIF